MLLKEFGFPIDATLTGFFVLPLGLRWSGFIYLKKKDVLKGYIPDKVHVD